MSRDIAAITRMVAQASRDSHPGRKDGQRLLCTGSQGSGHELALLYGGLCHPLAPGNENLGAWGRRNRTVRESQVFPMLYVNHIGSYRLLGISIRGLQLPCAIERCQW
jgi:hypothetical protein